MDEQFELAKKFGYVESVGLKDPSDSRGRSYLIKPDDLVPYDHATTPLSDDEVDELKEQGYPVGVIAPKF